MVEKNELLTRNIYMEKRIYYTIEMYQKCDDNINKTWYRREEKFLCTFVFTFPSIERNETQFLFSRLVPWKVKFYYLN